MGQRGLAAACVCCIYMYMYTELATFDLWTCTLTLMGPSSTDVCVVPAFPVKPIYSP